MQSYFNTLLFWFHTNHLALDVKREWSRKIIKRISP